MKLYDFSIFAQRRDAVRREQAARAAVMDAVVHIQEPGAVIQLKHRVDGWFSLHQDTLEKITNIG